MGSHQRLQPGMVIRGQRDRACKRHGHSHCPYDERRRHLTGTSPSCYPLLSSQSTGAGFTKWTSSSLHLPSILPHNLRLYALLRKAHTVLAYLLFVMFIAHVGAMLFHTLIVRDGMLLRMAPWNMRAQQKDAPTGAGGKSGET